MSIVEFDGSPSSETGESTKYPWVVGPVEGTDTSTVSTPLKGLKEEKRQDPRE